ncbi:hypothetical protein [Dyadobacter sp. 32]|uniref:hypothetical protein n=1 Tax=Dyadobacter sp. 32 TaxID=538966 RepID=UPI0011EC9C20
MKNQQRREEDELMRNVGLIELTEDNVVDLKGLFDEEFVEKGIGSRTGYFVGRGLIEKILAENENAEGILISFGLNREIDRDGEIQLIFEPSNSNEADGVILGKPKYGTGVPGIEGPSGTLPAIKPTPKPTA